MIGGENAMQWMYSLLGMRGNGGIWSKIVNGMNKQGKRGTTLSLIALGVGALAFGMRRMNQR